MQAHLSGQVSGHVSNQVQGGNQLAGMPPRNGGAPSYPMQNLGGGGSVGMGMGMNGAPAGNVVQNTLSMDQEFIQARSFMQEKIFLFLARRQQHQPINQSQIQRFKDIVKRLEEGLFKNALSKEEYLNMDTLEVRLHNLIRRSSVGNRAPPVSSSLTTTMIPTPGMSSHGGSSNVMVTTSNSMDASTNTVGGGGGYNSASTTVHSGTLLSTVGVPGRPLSRGVDGSLSNGYQQASANYNVGSSGNNTSSYGAQRMSSQMIPTPGFNNSSGSKGYLNSEGSSNNGRFSAAELATASVVPQQQHQKMHSGISNQSSSHSFHGFGGQSIDGMGSGMQHTFQNGAQNGALGMSGNSMIGSGTSEGFHNATVYADSPKTSMHQFDQYQQQPLQGDGYMGNTDVSGQGGFIGDGTSVGSMMNAQNTSSAAMQSVSRTNPSLISSHSNNLPNQQQSFVPSHQRQQFLSQGHQYQQQPQMLQRQHIQQNQQQQQHQFGEGFGMSGDLQSQIKHEPGVSNHDVIMQPQDSENTQFTEIHNQFQQISAEDISRVQYMSMPTSQNNMASSLPQSAQQMQNFIQPEQLLESQSEFGHLPVGMSSDSMLQGQWQDGNNNVLANTSYEQHARSGQDVAQRNNGSSENSTNLSNGTWRPGSTDRERQFNNQKRWLLFLRHARRCGAPEGKCPESNCITVQKLWRHMENCKSPQCLFPRCRHTKILIDHHRQCVDPGCPVCVPVKLFVQAQRKSRPRSESASSLANSVGSCKLSDTGDTSAQMCSKNPPMIGHSEESRPSHKRIKADFPTQTLLKHELENPEVSMSQPGIAASNVVLNHGRQQHGKTSILIKKELAEMKMETSASSGQRSPYVGEMKGKGADGISGKRIEKEPVREIPKPIVKIDKETDQVKEESEEEPDEPVTATKSGKPKIKGVSLIELFTPEQVREHIFGLRQWVGQSKSKVEKNQAMEHSMSENSCQLCAVERLTFEPPPIYCTPCGSRIKRNAMYYTVGAGDTRHYFCIPCYNDARGDTIVADGVVIPKARVEKKKNDEETEEWWVQCDKCEAWQHQICALFNGRRNDGGQAEYTCPNCYTDEVEKGERKPLPQSAVLGAKDLPKTILSDHIEQRLAKKLRQERLERAKQQNRAYDEVPGAEALVVRVVSSVDKKLEVKQRFLEIFQEQNYPTEFPYKSKVVLLFQKIEGVEVCLFGMYVQEFGSECLHPNQRRVYLSYLDSVKYFRPEIKSVTGEALRTFVYHEILIGYLEYCKLRGFASCYIWACPPLKGEDYILYCHPEIQKTPKSDKLREWYLAMLKKATKENIVVDLTNLYDHFFTSTGECKAKVTAARLPYFDGDYWPGAAEELIYQIRQEEDGKKLNKKGAMKKTITKRALKASGHDLSGNGSKDLLLMHRLGETISPMKEDFIMVHLQHPCAHCCILMVSGNRWVCSVCKNFQICDKCYEAELKREERERHPLYHRDVHSLYPIEIDEIPDDTKDRDEILESEFFDTRQAFLSLCQGNHYQYDTLRRAKHSSMMVLYHLHNPTAPAFVTTCNICSLDIEAGQGWRCEVCPEYDVCNACYKKDGAVDHPHKLTNHPSLAERDAQNQEARQLRVLQLRKMLDLLVHASQCRSGQCQYPNCRKVKGLFRHGIQCKVRASGGCVLCKKMWYLLQLHSRACKESECNVPRCKDLKEHLRRLTQQADTRRRAAVMEMMRQRAAEVATNDG